MNWRDWREDVCQQDDFADDGGPPVDLATLCRKQFGPNRRGEAGYCTLPKEHKGECGWATKAGAHLNLLASALEPMPVREGLGRLVIVVLGGLALAAIGLWWQ